MNKKLLFKLIATLVGIIAMAIAYLIISNTDDDWVNHPNNHKWGSYETKE